MKEYTLKMYELQEPTRIIAHTARNRKPENIGYEMKILDNFEDKNNKGLLGPCRHCWR